MMALVVIVPLACLAVMSWLAFNAPHGYETDDGFHYGDPRDGEG